MRFLLLVFLFACSNTKNLRDNQFLLNSAEIKGNKNISGSDLALLYKQKPNTKILGPKIPLSLYNFGVKFLDTSKVRKQLIDTRAKYDNLLKKDSSNHNRYDRLTTKRDKKLGKLNKKLKEGNFLMRSGEPPAIYDSVLTNQTVRSMKFYINSHGYMEGNVGLKIDTSGKNIDVTYLITEGEAYRLKNVVYKIKDLKVDSLVKTNLKDSNLKVGEVYEEGKASAERDRLYKLMKNNGYYDFSPQFIHFNVDTTQEKRNVVVQLVIINPPGKDGHILYRVKDVYFITDHNPRDKDERMDTLEYSGIEYVYQNKNFSKRILNKKIKMHSGDKYNQSSITESQKQLSGLDAYKSVNINFHKEKLDSTKLKAIIEARTFEKHQLSDEGGLNVSQASVPGPFASVNFRERNLFGGFEILDLNLKASVSGQAGVLQQSSILKTEEYNASIGLTLPELYLPTSFRDRYDNYNPRTRFMLGYNIIRRPEYERSALQNSMAYTFNTSPQKQYNISLIDVSIINTAQISDTFKLYLESLQSKGNNLIYGFRSSFVSDMNASYIYNTHEIGVNKKARYAKYYIESGGTTANLINTEKISGLQTFKYLKINTDFRYYFPVNKNTFAMRFNLGIADPYGSNHALPYEKYFFVGGTNSIRAWRPRRLGPGAYAPLNPDGSVNYKFERPGELLLETSYEYRFKMISFFEGAFFVDAGNIWTLRKDNSRPGAEFKPASFFNQVAIGTGFGLRLNFSFLILRLDLGIKAYDPAVKQFVLTTTGLKQSVLNIGIGYPF